jgi:hypothetical protein
MSDQSDPPTPDEPLNPDKFSDDGSAWEVLLPDGTWGKLVPREGESRSPAEDGNTVEEG